MPSNNIFSKLFSVNVPDILRIKFPTLFSHSLYSKGSLLLIYFPTLCALVLLITLLSHSQHSFVPLLMRNEIHSPQFSRRLIKKKWYWYWYKSPNHSVLHNNKHCQARENVTWKKCFKIIISKSFKLFYPQSWRK